MFGYGRTFLYFEGHAFVYTRIIVGSVITFKRAPDCAGYVPRWIILVFFLLLSGTQCYGRFALSSPNAILELACHCPARLSPLCSAYVDTEP